MINTEGYEIVAEVTEATLLSILQAAWKSGGDASGEGVIPEYIELPAGTPVGPYQLCDGTVQILHDQVGLTLNPPINGVNITLGTIIHLEIEDPPVESATFFDLTADVRVEAPFGHPEADSANLGLMLSGLPDGAVGVTLTSGDPIAPIIDAAIEEYIHQLFQENGATFPHLIEDVPVNLPPFSMLASIQFFDDESDPARRITVVKPNPNQIRLDVPCHIRFYDIEGDFFGFTLASPMGITATVQILADYVEEPGRVAAMLSTSVVTLANIQPAPGVEGVNYNTNAAMVDLARTFDPSIPTLDDAIAAGFATAATPIVNSMPDPDISYPTVAEIEAEMETLVRQELEARRYIMIWQPDTADSEFSVDDVTAKVLPDVLAIALNGGAAANADALVNFIPGDCDFATIVDGPTITDAFDAQIAEQFPDGFPTRIDPDLTEGHKIDLNALDISLRDGSIRISGDLTLVDAILGSIDVDASFTADMGLRWVDAPDGNGQIIEPFIIGDPDVDIDLSIFGWIIAILTGFLLFGVVGIIIAVIVILIAESIAESIGAEMFRDAADELTGIGAWPDLLQNIGDIDARFKNPIDIFHNGIRVRGEMTVTSMFELTAVDFANSHGPYFLMAGVPVNLNGGAELPESSGNWEFGDGQAANLRNVAHTYGDSGLYVAKLRVQVNQAGGATTRHFAAVRLQNVPPTVELGPMITVQEGQEFEIIGSFTDPEWLDTHTARFDFGDNSKPVTAVVNETNEEPEARGTARANHTYCDNGRYTVKLTVEDDDGGIGEATTIVVVENVPPHVEAPEHLCILARQKVVLQASFTDPGWCDTHTAEWEFGDCQSGDAIVTETHEPPMGRGIVEACHVYEECGTYLATVRVTDDDGGVGEASTLIHVVKVQNPHMEDGFRLIPQFERGEEIVANEWFPYLSNFPSLDPKALEMPREVRFVGDQFVVRDGQRAQQIDFRGTVQAGIYQTLCANKGWDYELRAFYHLPGRVTGVASVGIDPTGGTDPSSSDIVWVEGPNSNEWRTLAVRTTAQAEQITLFLGGVERHGGVNRIFWDRAALCAIQPFCPDIPDVDQPCEDVCINFTELPPPLVYQAPFHYRQLEITPLGQEVRGFDLGDPPGQLKLAFPPEGVRFDFPLPVSEVKMTVNNYAGRILRFQVFDGPVIVQEFTEIVYNEVRTVAIAAPQITAVAVMGGNNESSVAEICLCLPPETAIVKDNDKKIA